MNDFISYKLIPFLTGEYKKPDVFITHMNYLNWRWLKKSMQKSLKYLQGTCVDIGSGNSPYKNMILNQIDKYIAIDKGDVHKHMFKSSKEEFLEGDVKNLPLEDNPADCIIFTQVLEHVDEPFVALSEIKRVLKKDGVLILSVPFIYQAHAVPYDYFRFSEYGLKKIMKDYEFEIIEFHYQGYFGTTIISIINGFVWEMASKNKTMRNFILLPFLLLLFGANNFVGLVLDIIKNKNFTPNFWLIVRKK